MSAFVIGSGHRAPTDYELWRVFHRVDLDQLFLVNVDVSSSDDPSPERRFALVTATSRREAEDLGAREIKNRYGGDWSFAVSVQTYTPAYREALFEKFRSQMRNR